MKDQEAQKIQIDKETKDLIGRLSKFYSGVIDDILDELGIWGYMRGISLYGVFPKVKYFTLFCYWSHCSTNIWQCS